MNIVKPTRTQLELGLLVGGTLLLLWLYRSYLERSLALQQAYMDELLAERDRDQAAHAATNGSNGPDAVISALERILAGRQTGPVPAPPPPGDPA